MFFNIARQGKNSFSLYLATIVLVIIGFIIGQVPLLVAVISATAGNPEVMQEFMETNDVSAVNIEQNTFLALMILSFLGGSLGLWLGVTKFHQRAFRTIITPFKKINWSKLFFSFGLWFGLTLLAEAVFYFFHPDNYILQFNAEQFLPLLVIALLLLPIQTSTEEFLFRGYLMQGIGLVSKYRWIPLTLTSIGFGLLHIANPEVSEFGTGIMMVYYIGVGLFLGMLTLMDDSMELALGVHAGTNIYGALMVTFSASAVQTPAIFLMKEVSVMAMLVAFLLIAIIFAVIVAKKYKWTNWSKVYGNIAPPLEDATDINTP